MIICNSSTSATKGNLILESGDSGIITLVCLFHPRPGRILMISIMLTESLLILKKGPFLVAANA